MSAEVEIGVDPVAEGGEMQFVQTSDLGLREVVERELRERRAPPQCERFPEKLPPLVGREVPRVSKRALEAIRIDLIRGDLQEIAGRLGHQHVWTQQPAELRDEVVQRRRSRLRRLFAPEVADELFGGQDAARLEEKRREHGPLALAAERHRLVVGTGPRGDRGCRTQASQTSSSTPRALANSGLAARLPAVSQPFRGGSTVVS